MFEGLPALLHKLQQSIDELNERVMALANNTQSNFEILETRLNEKLEVLKQEILQRNGN